MLFSSLILVEWPGPARPRYGVNHTTCHTLHGRNEVGRRCPMWTDQDGQGQTRASPTTNRGKDPLERHEARGLAT